MVWGSWEGWGAGFGTAFVIKGFPLDGWSCEPCTEKRMVRKIFNFRKSVLLAPWRSTGVSGRLGWRRFATFAAGALAAALFYHVIFGQNGLTVYEQKREETQALSSQVQSLQRENELQKSHVDRLQSDPDAIEHQAREELHYTRPGEVIYTLPATSAPSTSDTIQK